MIPRWIRSIFGSASRPGSGTRPGDDVVNAYLDRRGDERSSDQFLDAMLRDPELLDNLANQRPWLDDVARRPSRAPDQADAVLRRLGLEARGIRPARRYAHAGSRKPLLCVVCLGAFSFGMWARSQSFMTMQVHPEGRIDQALSDVVDQVPDDLQPLETVQTALLRLGEDISDSMPRRRGTFASVRDAHTPTSSSQATVWYVLGPVATSATLEAASDDQRTARPSSTPQRNRRPVRSSMDDWHYRAPLIESDVMDTPLRDEPDILDAIKDLGCV